jgi:hypothetical protein
MNMSVTEEQRREIKCLVNQLVTLSKAIGTFDYDEQRVGLKAHDIVATIEIYFEERGRRIRRV